MIAELAPKIGVRNACDAVGVAQASYYRRHRRSPPPQRPAPLPHQDRPQPRALSESERAAILDELHSERFVDMSPTEVWATLLMKAATSARSPRSTGCYVRPARAGNGAGRPPTRPP